MTPEALREAFRKRLTVDSKSQDRRRRDFNYAIFDPDEGWAVFNDTDLDMVMSAFDDAVRDVRREDKRAAKKITAKAMRRSMQKVSDHT